MSRATSNFQTPQNNYLVPKALIGMLRFTMFSLVEMSDNARYSNVICMLLLFFNASCRQRILEMSRQKTLFSVLLWSRASQPRHVIRWRSWTTFSPSPSNRRHMIGQLPTAIATCGCMSTSWIYLSFVRAPAGHQLIRNGLCRKRHTA